MKQVRAIAVVAADGRDPVAIRRDLLNDQEMGPILEDMEEVQRPEWKDNSDRSPTCKGC